jgi:uncharacterized protein (DUF952 family)
MPNNLPVAQACIVHMASSADWAEAQRNGVYADDALARDGFIHFSKPEQLLRVANHPTNPFLARRDLVLLYVDPANLKAELRYEVPPGEQEAYPHLYGPLNLDAVMRAVSFTPRADGRYVLPDDLS